MQIGLSLTYLLVPDKVLSLIGKKLGPELVFGNKAAGLAKYRLDGAYVHVTMSWHGQGLGGTSG